MKIQTLSSSNKIKSLDVFFLDAQGRTLYSERANGENYSIPAKLSAIKGFRYLRYHANF